MGRNSHCASSIMRQVKGRRRSWLLSIHSPLPLRLTKRGVFPLCFRRHPVRTLLCAGAWRGGRHGAPVHGRHRRGPRRARHIATLRYQFPYMEQGSKRPDSPESPNRPSGRRSAEASRLVPELPLFAGGKSFGGRMTSQAQAESPLPGVRGLVFLGFPLHPPGQPSDERAKHLFHVQVPMLFLQGTRDEFASLELLQRLIATARHTRNPQAVSGRRSFLSRPCSHRTQGCGSRAEMLDALANWIEGSDCEQRINLSPLSHPCDQSHITHYESTTSEPAATPIKSGKECSIPRACRKADAPLLRRDISAPSRSTTPSIVCPSPCARSLGT